MTPSRPSFRSLLDALTEGLAGGDSDDPRQEARWILNHVLEKPPSHPVDVVPGPVPEGVEDRAWTLTRRRRGGEPLQLVLGEWDFCGHTVTVRPGVLIPRPETESLVAWILEDHPDTPITVLELGCGSGVISVSLKHARPSWTLIATDLDPRALALTRTNARRLAVDVDLVHHDMACPLGRTGSIDVLVSNPPYISHRDMQELPPVVADHDPALALDGGPDGCRSIGHVLDRARDLLRGGGRVYLEMASDQRRAVTALMESRGFTDIECRPDLGGLDRMMTGIKPDPTDPHDRHPPRSRLP